MIYVEKPMPKKTNELAVIYLVDSSFTSSAAKIHTGLLREQIGICLHVQDLILMGEYAKPEPQYENVFKMWKSHSKALEAYLYWLHHDYVVTTGKGVYHNGVKIQPEQHCFWYAPLWYQCPKMIDSHRAALLYLFPEEYERFEWEVEPKIDIFWP